MTNPNLQSVYDQVRDMYSGLTPEEIMQVESRVRPVLNSINEAIWSKGDAPDFNKAIKAVYEVSETTPVKSLRMLSGTGFSELPEEMSRQTLVAFDTVENLEMAVNQIYLKVVGKGPEEKKSFVKAAGPVCRQMSDIYRNIRSDYLDAVAGAMVLATLDKTVKDFTAVSYEPTVTKGLESLDTDLYARLSGLLDSIQEKRGLIPLIAKKKSDSHSRVEDMRFAVYGFRKSEVEPDGVKGQYPMTKKLPPGNVNPHKVKAP